MKYPSVHTPPVLNFVPFTAYHLLIMYDFYVPLEHPPPPNNVTLFFFLLIHSLLKLFCVLLLSNKKMSLRTKSWEPLCNTKQIACTRKTWSTVAGPGLFHLGVPS